MSTGYSVLRTGTVDVLLLTTSDAVATHTLVYDHRIRLVEVLLQGGRRVEACVGKRMRNVGHVGHISIVGRKVVHLMS